MTESLTEKVGGCPVCDRHAGTIYTLDEERPQGYLAQVVGVVSICVDDDGTVYVHTNDLPTDRLDVHRLTVQDP